MREVLLQAVLEFVRDARRQPDIQRIALIGSLTTSKPHPKDADVLVTLVSLDHLAGLAALGRKLKGAAQKHNLGADIFICTPDHQYLGRTCSYRECRPRVACTGQHCRPGGHLNDDLHLVTLPTELIRHPPIELWPNPECRIALPDDVRDRLVAALRLDRGIPPASQ